jgi:hypothetical protein
MTHVMRRYRGTGVAAIITAVLGAAALFAVSAPPASAAYGTCGSGDFCLRYFHHLTGGLYHYAGNDPNLNNDHFEVSSTNRIVGNNTVSANNRGEFGPKADVLVYTQTGYRGARDCIVRGDRGELPRNWWNSIESYRWVTPSECRAAGVIDLK